jgi:phage tail sheath protein FI
MPVTPTYPGVYIEEIPSGVRTIVGVATNIAAFVGRALSGPVNEPTIINSFADFDRQFGGLAMDYPMSYAVNDFYQNGGSQAIIVRLFSGKAAGQTGVAQITVDTLKLVASSPGMWGNSLTATADVSGITADVAGRYGLQPADLFNLTVTEVINGQTVSQERFLNLTVKPDAGLSGAARAQRVDRVLEQSSQLVAVPTDANGNPILPAAPPKPTVVGTAAAPAAPAAAAGAAGAPPAAAAGAGGAAAPAGGAAAGGAAAAGGGAAGGAPPAAAAGAGGAAAAPAAPAGPPQGSGGDDGQALQDSDYLATQVPPIPKSGIFALETADLFNLLCIPPDTRGGDTSPNVYSGAMAYCQKRRAMLIVDSPAAWSANAANAANTAQNKFSNPGIGDLSLTGDGARNAALYFPRVEEADPLSQGQIDTFAPCGIIAGVMARTDVSRGVWKAPAGIDATLNGIAGLQVNLTNDENGQLNPLGINCLRTFPVYGSVVWGARTLRGADQLADDYKYVPVRRLALFLEESLYRGTQWVVFEPNDEPLWSQIRLNVGSFMHNLFVQGAFQGQTPTDAYFVNCDKNTTTQNDINLGIVNIVVGFAPLKPAEFVVLQIQQIAGNILT